MLSLNMNPLLASSYSSGSQRVRVITEKWAEDNLYCAACSSTALVRERSNTPAIDFTCDACDAPYQLKSMRHWNERTVVDGSYRALVKSIQSDASPNLILLGYTDTWKVNELMLVPSFFFSESMIQARRPLSPSARRAGWIGCNILLSAVPSPGKIRLVSGGHVMALGDVRTRYASIAPIRQIPPQIRGWTLDVLRVIQSLDKRIFELKDVYCHEHSLALLHPDNCHLRAKIRQQLQILRDIGLLTFLGGGTYSY